MVSIHSNPIAVTAIRSFTQAADDIQKATTELATGRRTVNPAAEVAASKLLSDSGTILVIRNGLERGKLVATLAEAAIEQVQGTLGQIREAVIAGQPGGQFPEFAQKQAALLLGTVDDIVCQATAYGVNVIAGGTGGPVRTTTSTSIRSLEGHSLTLGGSGTAAMNATAAGLGLANFTLSGPGAILDFRGIKLPHLSVDDGSPTTVTLQTTNYGDFSRETPSFPGRQWAFQFVTDSPPPSGSAEEPQLDAEGNLLRIKTTIPIPLPANFTVEDVVAALRNSLQEVGFEVRSAPDEDKILRVAGNNVAPSVGSTQNLKPGPDPTAYIGTAVPKAVPAGSNVIPLSHVNARMVGGDIPQPWAGSFLDPTATITAIDAVAGTITVSPATLSTIPADTPLIVRSFQPEVSFGRWEGPDAAIATLDSALRRSSSIGQMIGSHANQINASQDLLSMKSDALIMGAGFLVDADIPKAQARLLAAQVRQQLAAEGLSIANHAAKQLLMLFSPEQN